MSNEDRILNRIDLERAIDTYPPVIRDALRLYRDGYKLREIAELLGINPNTLRHHLGMAGFAGMPYNGRGTSTPSRYTKPKSAKTKLPAFNPDPAWHAYVESLEPLIQKIVRKFTEDEDLRKDCAQEARIALYCANPERTKAFRDYQEGKLSEAVYRNRVKSYCGNLIRNQRSGIVPHAKLCTADDEQFQHHGSGRAGNG